MAMRCHLLNLGENRNYFPIYSKNSKKIFYFEKSLQNFSKNLFQILVFRRHHVLNDPINFFDPDGLKRYNASAPKTVPVTGATETSLDCLEKCLQKVTNNPSLDLLINGGAEKSGHSRNSAHYQNEACDIASPKFNPISTDDINACASGCGFGAGQWEPRTGPNSAHWHLQIKPGNNVPPLPIQGGP